MKKEPKNKPNIAAMTGRAIVKKYLESFGKDAFKEYLGVNVSNFLADNFEEIREFIKNNTSLLSLLIIYYFVNFCVIFWFIFYRRTFIISNNN